MKYPPYAKASEDYPPVAKSTEAAIFRPKNGSDTAHAFIHGQSPCLHAEVRFGTQAWSSA